MFEIATIIILILSIVLHEIAHGYAANQLGDPTARLAGRLTLNPISHIDLVGSIIVPGFLLITGANFLFGWAKPVPYNPYNLRNPKWGESIVAAAGPLTNLFLAVIFAMLVRFASTLGLPYSFVEIAEYVVFINVLLALFNAIPFPPLDGSKIITPFLPLTLRYKYQAMTSYVQNMGIIVMFLMVFIFLQILWTPFFALVSGLTGFLLGY